MLTKAQIFALVSLMILFVGCGGSGSTSSSTDSNAPAAAGQSAVSDETSAPDVVKVAVGSPDHTTLVKAVLAVKYEDILSNAGPFTVFAPVNKAFDALPAGTVETLLKPENKDKLIDILEYHVWVGVFDVATVEKEQVLDMVNSKKVKITKNGDKHYINGNEILGSVKASNGIIYVIDKVLTPGS